MIPSTWFYEFQATKEGKKTIKLPYRVQAIKDDIFTIAGIYEIWKDKDEKEIQSVTILTCQAIPPLSKIHDRQPVIINKKDREKWLSKETSPEEAYPLLKPTKNLEYFQIDHAFNKTFGKNVTEELLKPI